MEQALFAAGCFWGVEATFAKISGVTATAVGYAGGASLNPTYDDVCNRNTGHAEVVQVTFDPALVSYATLVEAFFALHNPTQLNRQGPDIGDQYRSEIFTLSSAQEATAITVRDKVAQSGRYTEPIVTRVTPAPTFWRAEEYHQQYFAKRGGGNCHI